MDAYKQLIQNVLTKGELVQSNKGEKYRLLAATVSYDVSEKMPIVTGKKTNFLWAMAEYAMFLKGENNIEFLKTYGAEKIWEKQALSEDFIQTHRRTPIDMVEELAMKRGVEVEVLHQEFQTLTMEMLQKRQAFEMTDEYKNLTKEEIVTKYEEFDQPLRKIFMDAGVSFTEDKIKYPKGYLGPSYGKQWRDWSATLENGDRVRIDQIKTIVGILKTNPESNQIILNSWNPSAIALDTVAYDDKIKAGFVGQPPCHMAYHFITSKVNDEWQLSMNVIFRSNDLMLGHPFNVVGSTVMLHLIAAAAGMKPSKINLIISDAHIYKNHVDSGNVQKYLESNLYELPTFKLPEGVDVFNFTVQDLVSSLGEYNHGPHIPFQLNT